MTDPERNQLHKEIRQCQENRRHDTLADQDTPEDTTETQTLANAQVPQESEQLDDWERAIREERLSLLARHVTMEGVGEGSSSSSGSMRIHENERWIHVEHASSASHNVVTTRQWGLQVAPRGMAYQVYRPTGRTRLISTGEYIPEEDLGSDEVEEGQRISAVSVGAVKSTTSEDHYCMLDSGANVMVIPWKEGMKGDHTMCVLVGDNRTEGLVVARLSTRHRTHLIAAVKEAKPLIPISYLIRAIWRMMGEQDCFHMKDGEGDPVTVNEDEDLLYVGKTTLWRIGYDLYNSALHTTGMTWPDVWKTLTGEEAPIRSIFAIQAQTTVDVVELYN